MNIITTITSSKIPKQVDGVQVIKKRGKLEMLRGEKEDEMERRQSEGADEGKREGNRDLVIKTRGKPGCRGEK